ncbi:MAG: polyprenyl synthetase family protein [Clostridiales bacterium]|nr:polyprenyl synthetase family protein [Clostridiales bacterium]
MTNEEYRAAFDRYRRLTENELTRLFAVEGQCIYPRLREAMYYSLDAGGKRIRPCLVLAVCEMLGGDVQNALPLACGLEMIHTYSLIHDDMPGMDNDDMRRGRPSNHKVFGEGIALLAGDGLLSFAAEVMLNAAIDSKDPGVLMGAREIIRLSGASGMLTGQASDKMNENAPSVSPSVLDYVHKHKTADMLEAAVIAGAYAAHADVAVIKALRSYSYKMGLLFQITDDLLDVLGDEKAMGKTLGKDKEEGKLTFVTIYGIDGAMACARMAAEEAKECLSCVPGSGILSTFIDEMLNRNR